MKIATIISRVLLGLGFTIFGLNILHSFLPEPPIDSATLAGQWVGVMGPSHWMQVVGLFQLLGGLFILSGRLAPLGLALLAPILVNILAFHIFLQNGSGLAPGLVMSVFEIFLIYSYRKYFTPLFTTSASPN